MIGIAKTVDESVQTSGRLSVSTQHGFGDGSFAFELLVGERELDFLGFQMRERAFDRSQDFGMLAHGVEALGTMGLGVRPDGIGVGSDALRQRLVNLERKRFASAVAFVHGPRHFEVQSERGVHGD